MQELQTKSSNVLFKQKNPSQQLSFKFTVLKLNTRLKTTSDKLLGFKNDPLMERQFKYASKKQMGKYRSSHRTVKLKLPVVQRQQQLNPSVSLTVVPKQSPEEQFKNSQRREHARIKTISEVNPRLNRVKFDHLRTSIKSIPRKGNMNSSYLRFREFVESKGAQTRINVSCQQIAALKDSQRGEINRSADEVRLGSRYGQIPPEQFIYEDQSASLGRGIVQKISKMMRRHSRYPKYS